MKIKNKEYMLVNERLQIFRKEHPDWTIQTEWLKCDDGLAIAKAIIKDPEGRIIAEGTAMEVAGSTFINKTSHVENCETSAWGRALANFGIGLGTSVASAEEVLNAQLNQNRRLSTPEQSERFIDLLGRAGMTIPEAKTELKKIDIDGRIDLNILEKADLTKVSKPFAGVVNEFLKELSDGI